MIWCDFIFEMYGTEKRIFENLKVLSSKIKFVFFCYDLVSGYSGQEPLCQGDKGVNKVAVVYRSLIASCSAYFVKTI